MRPFLFDRQQKLAALLRENTDVLQAFNEGRVDVRRSCVDALHQASNVFAALEMRSFENEMQSLLARVVQTRSGMHPNGTEVFDRRKLESTAICFALAASGERLRDELARIERLFDEGREVLRNLIVDGLMAGRIVEESLPFADQRSVDLGWQVLREHPPNRQTTLRLETLLHPADLSLLLWEESHVSTLASQ